MKSLFKKLIIGIAIFGSFSGSAFAQLQGNLTRCAQSVYIVDVEMGVPAKGYNHFQIGYSSKPYRDTSMTLIPSGPEVDDYSGRALYEQSINAMDMGLKVDLFDDSIISNCSTFDAMDAYIVPPSSS